ncbi:MAG: glycosyltransferase family 4 protein [Verrucomicrobiae bacterium]|nr:glycosyltransferase family 4 protein [Verrucomicrobiae bacterium]
MHIALNLLYLLPGVVGGTETYARLLINELLALAAEGASDRYTAFVNRESVEHLSAIHTGITFVPCNVEATKRPVRYLFEQARLPALLRGNQVDVLHSLGYVGPWYPGVPHVVTIHDLIYTGFAAHMPQSRRLTLQIAVRGVARRANRIITVSESSRRQIVEDLPDVASKIVVIPEAPRPGLAPVVGDAGNVADQYVLRHYGIKQPYLVAFSSKSTSKNIPRLIKAMAQVTDLPWCLVLIGHVPDNGEVAAAVSASKMGDRVMSTGYVPDSDLPPLLRQAKLFVSPSLYEGFGLSVLDAQSAGVPVACSDVASLPEVAGNGAEFFDPYSPMAIAASVRRLLSDSAYSRMLSDRGRANAARFSWRRTAEATREVYRMLQSGRVMSDPF